MIFNTARIPELSSSQMKTSVHCGRQEVYRPDPASSPSKFQVLIVDDDDADIYALKKHLAAIRGADVDVRVEKSGRAATEDLGDEHFDICFVDFWLGSDTSIKLIQRLLQEKNTQVVLVTGMGSDAVRDLGFCAGAAGYLDKNDISRDAVSDILSRLCG